MSDGLMIILVIVVWLFVLAPLLLRGQRPINKTGEAFDDTRVVYEGGSGDLPARRQPRVLPEDVRPRHEEDDDYELVEAFAEDDDILIDERADAPHEPVAEPVEKEEEPEPVVEGEVVEEPAGELPRGGSTAYSALERAEEVTAPVAEAVDEGDVYEDDDAYVSAADYLHPATRLPAAPPEEEVAVAEPVAVLDGDEDEEALVDDADLTDEELAFARRRVGRGGWDPESDRKYSVDRYQRRRRTLTGLLIAVAAALALSVVLGGWVWVTVLLTGALTVFYLVALRKQVREEKALRARRIRHLRRARMGVRRADDAEGAVPRELRRPGAVVVELDDESPDFDYLDVTEATFERPTLRPVPGGGDLNSRRAG